MEDITILSPGQRLKEIRKILKLRQEELAGDKFSKNYISMFENNKRTINAINASYLADQINVLASQRGSEMEITSSYLLKSDKDIAREKCEHWLNEVEANLSLGLEQIYTNLYKVIQISSKYGIHCYKAKAVYLKGLYSFQRKLYDCAMTQLLEALVYYAQENDYNYIGDIYAKLGMILFKQGNFKQALVYFNLSHCILKTCESEEDRVIEDLKYYKALSYYKMGQYSIAQNMLGKVTTKNIKFLELASQINRALVV